MRLKSDIFRWYIFFKFSGKNGWWVDTGVHEDRINRAGELVLWQII